MKEIHGRGGEGPSSGRGSETGGVRGGRFKDSSVRLEGIHGEQSKRNARDGANKHSRPSDLQVLPTVGQRGSKAKQYTSESNTNETGYSTQTSRISIVLGGVGQLAMRTWSGFVQATCR